MASITITGASDDLIELDGDIREEFPYTDEGNGDLLAFSDGTILRVTFDRGVWRITQVRRGAETNLIHQEGIEGDEDNRTDVVSLYGDISWVVHARSYAGLKVSTPTI